EETLLRRGRCLARRQNTQPWDRAVGPSWDQSPAKKKGAEFSFETDADRPRSRTRAMTTVTKMLTFSRSICSCRISRALSKETPLFFMILRISSEARPGLVSPSAKFWVTSKVDDVRPSSMSCSKLSEVRGTGL